MALLEKQRLAVWEHPQNEVIQTMPRAYAQKVLRTRPDKLTFYLPLWDAPGNKFPDYSQNALTISKLDCSVNVKSIGDGWGCPKGTGTAAWANLYSAALNSLWNGNEGSLLFWVGVDAVSDWSGGINPAFVYLYSSSSNQLGCFRLSTAKWYISYGAGFSPVVFNPNCPTDTAWHNVICTWSKTAGKFRAWQDGVSMGADKNVVINWSGALGANTCLIGANSLAGNQLWNRYLGHIALWSTPLTDAQVAFLSKM